MIYKKSFLFTTTCLLATLFCSSFSFADDTKLATQTPVVPVNTPHLASLQNSPNPTAADVKNSTHASPVVAQTFVTPPPPPSLNVKAYVLMDAATGKILAAYNPDALLAPASLTKMMTAYVISMAIKEGKVHMDDNVTISEKAWRTGGSKMFVKVGSQVPVRDLMQGIIVDSGNDACVAMAEHVAGSEDSFASLMNQTAAALGMTNSHFVDSTGLPNPAHHSTAHDLALLARGVVYSFPEDYQWYSQKWFTYNGIRQPNRNRLLWRDPSVDGIKTGHTDDAGFCLVSSAKRNGTRLIAVVMGAPSDAARADDSQKLLDYGFHFFETHLVYPANTKLASLRVWNGATREIPVGVINPLVVSLVPGQFSHINMQMTLNKHLIAPITKGQKVGDIQLTLNDKIIETADVVALVDDPYGNMLRRAYDHIAGWFHKRK